MKILICNAKSTCPIIHIPTLHPQDNILQPALGSSLLQPLSASNHSNTAYTTSGTAAAAGDLLADAKAAPVAVGSTWSNSAGRIAIDLDNLMSGKAGKASGPAPTMNQLKVQSPAKIAQPSSVALPPPFQANLIGAPIGVTSAPQYSHIPAAVAANVPQQQQQQQQMFGNLVSNQFNAFQ